MKDDGASLRDLKATIGCSHVTIRDFLLGGLAGEDIQDYFRRKDFGGSVDAMRDAAAAYAEEHPEAIGATPDDPLPNRRELRSMPQFRSLPPDVKTAIERESREGDLPFWTWCAEVERLLRLRAGGQLGAGFEGKEWRPAKVRAQKRPAKRSGRA